MTHLTETSKYTYILTQKVMITLRWFEKFCDILKKSLVTREKQKRCTYSILLTLTVLMVTTVTC